ncbi:MAG: hypothetical protein BIFFINMI_03224 [Phycisphaerae bacterium]|nr:hypothetical protein [Phycisphaerae bacterium]
MDCMIAASGLVDLLQTTGLIVLVVIGFSAVIFVHELGHFLVAKWGGIRVERFAIGFGPRLFGIKRGETDYCINLLPLGGYVKMTGQEDFRLEQEAKPDPRAYNNATVGVRMWVVSAGVIMNVIFAAILLTIVFLVGVKFPPSQVGNVEFGSPAWKAGIQPGVTVTSAAGDKTVDFQDLLLATALSKGGQPVPLSYRDLDGRQREADLRAEAGPIQGLPYLGFSPEATLQLPDSLDPQSMERFNKLKERYVVSGDLKLNDRIVAIWADGQWRPVTLLSDLVRQVRGGDGLPFRVRLQQKAKGDGGEIHEATLRPELPDPSTAKDLSLFGAHPSLRVEGTVPGKPADGKLLKGDIIRRVSEIDYPFFEQFSQAAQAKGGESMAVDVLRDGKLVTTELTPGKRWFESRETVGVELALSTQQAVVGQVDADSVLGRAGLPGGAIILGIGGPDRTPTTQPDNAPISWGEFHAGLRASAGGAATIVYTLGPDGSQSSLKLAVPALDKWPRSFTFNPPPLPFENYEVIYDAGGNPLRAAWMGCQKAWQFIMQAYVTIDRLVSPSSKIGMKHLSGPVGIAHASYKFAEAGWVKLLYFLALISASLAVLNFLPLPIVDGGLFVFLIIEKIKKKPVSIKVMQATQIIGLVLIGGLFLWVTWQDILRLLVS